MTLAETFDFLRGFHRRAPFLFYNGNTFADAGRQLAAVLFADLPAARRRECVSAAGDYVAGVLDRESLAAIVDELCADCDFQPGVRVQTLRGSSRGIVTRVLPDGRIAWRPEGGEMEFISLPEALKPVPIR